MGDCVKGSGDVPQEELGPPVFEFEEAEGEREAAAAAALKGTESRLLREPMAVDPVMDRVEALPDLKNWPEFDCSCCSCGLGVGNSFSLSKLQTELFFCPFRPLCWGLTGCDVDCLSLLSGGPGSAPNLGNSN